jgi:SOS response regulatory protein OraA/RecX
MSEPGAVDTAVKRLALAIDALDAAVERRRENDRSEDRLAQQLHALGIDRMRLAEALDAETAHTKQLTASNREIAQRLEVAMSSIQSVLDTNE